MPKHRNTPFEASLAGIPARLEQLRDELEMSHAEFARAAGVKRTQYDAWRKSDVVPGGPSLRRLSLNIGVTTDWLLGIPGARQYHSQSRDQVELEADLAAYIVQAVVRRFPREPAEVAVDGRRALRTAVRAGIEQFRKQTDRFLWRMTGESPDNAESRDFPKALLELELHERKPHAARGRPRRRRPLPKQPQEPEAAGPLRRKIAELLFADRMSESENRRRFLKSLTADERRLLKIPAATLAAYGAPAGDR